MSDRRSIPFAILQSALAVTAALYALSPTVYAFFGEMTMTYAFAPRWLASTPPARITARLFARYNAASPIADRLRRRPACSFVDEGAVRTGNCMHRVEGGQVTHGPPNLKLPAGSYVAHFDFAQDAACAAGVVQLQIVAVGRFGKVLASSAASISQGDGVELAFTLKPMDAGLSTVEFRVRGLSGCTLLRTVRWNEIDPTDSSERQQTHVPEAVASVAA